MLLQIKNKNNKYELRLENVSQWCGQNVQLKTMILNSLSKHFSTSKYMNWEDWMIDNVKINGVVPGRKRYQLIRISSKEDILRLLQFGKVSMLQQYIKYMVTEFNVQSEMGFIDDKLLHIFGMLNEQLNEDIPDIFVDYSVEALWDIVQHSEVKTTQGEYMENLGFEKLLTSFLNTLKAMQKKRPESYIIIFENIDHYVSRQEYSTILEKVTQLTREFDILCIFSISISGYLCTTNENITGITVFNDEVFSMPEWNCLRNFLEENYPIYGAENVWGDIERINTIVDMVACGQKEIDFKDLILLKEINQTLGMNISVKKELLKPEWEYLLS